MNGFQFHTTDSVRQLIDARYHVRFVGQGRPSSSAEVIRRFLRRERAADHGRAA